jgi:hypothetical protein
MALRLVPLSILLSSWLAAQAPVVDASTAAPPLPDAVAEAIVREGIDKSRVMHLLRELTGKVGHRLTGSDNFTKGCEWARAEFAKMGLEVELEKWGEWKLVWNRGPWTGRITKPVRLDLFVATEAWTAGTKGMQRGPVVMEPDWESGGTGDLAGKWVLSKLHVATRKDGRRLDRRERDLRRAELARRVGEAGGLGLVYRAEDPDGAYPNRVRVFGDHMTAMLPIDAVPKCPEIAVRADNYYHLLGLVTDGAKVECGFEIQNSFREGPIELHNVIATLPGTHKPDECVIVSSHLDSWHQVQGTTDNGTGTTTTMEAARILSTVGARPRRTIKFCLWGGEEEGLLGSHGYVRRHRTDMAKVSAVFNHDTGTNWAQSLGVTQAMHDQLAPIFTQVNRVLKAPDADWRGDVFELRVVPRVTGGGGSDHASFIEVGVPGLNWGLKGRSNYFQHTWHTQWDTIDVAIEEYQRHTATVIAMAALGTANLEGMLDRANVVPGGGRGGGEQSAAVAAALFEAELDGLKFTSVKPDGRAAKMGVQKDDVLKKVNGEVVERTRQIFQFAREATGDTITFTFQRGEKTFDASMKKDDLPARGRGDGPREGSREGQGAPPSRGETPGGGSQGGGNQGSGTPPGGTGGGEDAFAETLVAGFCPAG